MINKKWDRIEKERGRNKGLTHIWEMEARGWGEMNLVRVDVKRETMIDGWWNSS